MGRASSPNSHQRIVFVLAVATGLTWAAGCQKTSDILAPSPNSSDRVLHAVFRSQTDMVQHPDRRIILDGQALDREWGGQADPPGYLNIRVSSENGSGSAQPVAYVSVKAIYTENDLFLLIRWVDITVNDFKDAIIYRGPNLSQLPPACEPALLSEQSWLRNPGNAFDEDRIAIAFDVDSAGGAIGPYRQYGCRVACHAQETPQFGRLGYGRLDVWQWLASRTNPVRDLYSRAENPSDPLHGVTGYLDDLFADNVGGLQPDPGTPCYLPNFQPGSNVPTYVYRTTDDPFAKPLDPTHCRNSWGENPCRPNNGVLLHEIWREDTGLPVAPFGICDTVDQAPLPPGSETHRWQPGDATVVPPVLPDSVAGWILTYPSGSRADVHGKAQHDSGIWTLELGRPLVTGDPIHDVTFDPSSGRQYTFTIAVMDNSGTVHVGSEPQVLVFDPKGGK